MRVLSALNLLGVAGQVRPRAEDVPDWFYRFARSHVFFTGIPTVGIVLLLIGLRLIARRGAPVWTDFDIGLQLVTAAIVAVPIATVLRVSKEIVEFSGTTPSSSIRIGALILVALVILAIVLARAAGARGPSQPGTPPTSDDLVFGIFVPNLAGLSAVMMVLFFASRGGSLHG
jgi:hypothetical protein